MTNHTDLIRRLEAGETGRELDMAINWALAGERSRTPVTSSLDAAKALHDAALLNPEVEIIISTTGALVTVQPGEHHHYSHSDAPTPAAAWVAAILKAKSNE